MISLEISSRKLVLVFLASVSLSAVLPSSSSITKGRAAIQQDAARVDAQEQQRREDQSDYVNARPYMDESLDSLKKKIPELRKLKTATDQEFLAKILEKTAANVDSFFRDVVDLMAEEDIIEERKISISSKIHVRDNYLIVRGGDDTPSDVLEYRMDDAGKRIDQTVPRGFLVTSGFALISNCFSTIAQPESRFRYLGDQKIGSRQTYVVAFAQRPGQTSQLITFNMTGLGGSSVNILVQGIAWIDQTDFQIVRLRTDLLAPRPQIGLIRQTNEVNFGQVRFQDIANPLWLPTQVNVYLMVKQPGSLHETQFHNDHRYTNYRRYRVSVKIASPNGSE